MAPTPIHITNVSISLTIPEFAVLCDSNPGIYNKLPREVQLAVSSVSLDRMADSNNANDKLAIAAIQTFSA
jgi:hypothetical protein